jgi:hypothetical protein
MTDEFFGNQSDGTGALHPGCHHQQSPDRQHAGIGKSLQTFTQGCQAKGNRR